MATLQIRLDEQLRSKAQNVAAGMGIDLSTAVRLFLTQMVNENGLPFQPRADAFYSAPNVEALRRSIDQLRVGKTISKSLDELESMGK